MNSLPQITLPVLSGSSSPAMPETMPPASTVLKMLVSVPKLFNKAQIGGERLDLLRAEMACHHRHRRSRRRMISLAPLFEAGLDVEIGEASQPRDVPDALGIRPVAGIAGDNVGFGNSIHEDRSSARSEAAVAVIGG